MLPTPVVRNVDEKVYEPAEDSFLLLDCLEERIAALKTYKYPVVCEIGAGSGIVTAFLKANIFPHGFFLATDVNPTACQTILETVKGNDNTHFHSVDSCRMSLTLSIRENAVDVLVFNPPYVPAEEVPERPETDEDDKWLDLALLGGADGMVVTWEVLDNLGSILAPGGVAYILFCARNKPDDVARTMRGRGWRVETVECRRAGWEVLSVLEFLREK